MTKHRFSHGADPILRASVHLWVDLSRKQCAWAQAYYQADRANGQSHACALRCLGQALAQYSLENVANQNALRRGPPHP